MASSQWGSTGSSVSDLFIDSMMEQGFKPQVGNSCEVWTVYIESASDLTKIADTAHLIFGSHHPARRAKVTCAMYFLYPTGFEEGCVPTRETGEDSGAALVDQKSLLRMIKAVEKTGIPTRFPHPSGFYELLTSKRWTSMMCTTPHLRVPPTVALPRMLIEKSAKNVEDLRKAAQSALSALNAVKQNQCSMNNEKYPGDIQKGVAKLGFSWEALDVKFWDDGVEGLAKRLYDLTQSIEISRELTAQPHDLESIIVQEYCKHDLELRLYVVEGKVEARIFTKFCKIKDNNEFGDFHELFSPEEAAEAWMDGDMQSMRSGLQQCEEVTNQWMAWVRTQVCDVPPAIRFDYFVGRSSTPGKAIVWTLEICELGFSMLGQEDLPRKVFAAVVRSCLGKESDSNTAETAKAQSAVCIANGSTEETKKVVQKDEKKNSANTHRANPAAVEGSSSSAPSTLYVCVPWSASGTDDQVQCTGRYDIQTDRANKHPIWKLDNGDRWLYHGNDDHWYVGDDEEKDCDFDCDQGYIRKKAVSNKGPHELAGPWERGPDWKPDKSIIVSHEEPPDMKGKSKGKSGPKGKP